MTDRYDDELKLVLEDLTDLMQNEASSKKSKILQLLMNKQIFTLPNQFLKYLKYFLRNLNLTIQLSFDMLKMFFFYISQ